MSDDPLSSKKSKKTAHAEQRGLEGRPTDTAFNDAKTAKRSNVFVDVDKNRWVVRSKRGREHIFEMTGELLTSMDRSRSAHLTRLRNGTIRSITIAEFVTFRKVLG